MVEIETLAALVYGLQNGDAGAATQMYELFQPDIYYFILKTVNNDRELAEDLTQDTFMEVLETICHLQEPAAFVTWLRQIAYHKCTGYFRRKKELLADENEDGYSVFDTIEEDREEFIPDAALDKEDLKQTILAMINSLPEDQRSAIVLRYFNEISVKEIAEIQGVSEGTVKSRLNYGRKSIKQAVEEYEKKNDVKLHSFAVLPLLLWLFREYRIRNDLHLSSGVASQAFVIGEEAAGAAVIGAAATAGTAAGVNLLAYIAAAVLVLGGIAAGIALLPSRTEAPAETTACIETTQVPETTAEPTAETTVETTAETTAPTEATTAPTEETVPAETQPATTPAKPTTPPATTPPPEETTAPTQCVHDMVLKKQVYGLEYVNEIWACSKCGEEDHINYPNPCVHEGDIDENNILVCKHCGMAAYIPPT